MKYIIAISSFPKPNSIFLTFRDRLLFKDPQQSRHETQTDPKDLKVAQQIRFIAPIGG